MEKYNTKTTIFKWSVVLQVSFTNQFYCTHIDPSSENPNAYVKRRHSWISNPDLEFAIFRNKPYYWGILLEQSNTLGIILFDLLRTYYNTSSIISHFTVYIRACVSI